MFTQQTERKYISCGHDELSSELVKHISNEVSTSHNILINKSLNGGIFSDEYKMVKVLPVQKAKSKEDIGNYRPVSILPSLSKVFEKVLYKRTFGALNWNPK